MAGISPYEKETTQSEKYRAWSYGLLWVFLGVFTFSLSYFTSRNYPMDTIVPAILLIIGLWKLYQAWAQQFHAAR
jgi:ABC-type nickel/cobalt efflux system permease component RcnA